MKTWLQSKKKLLIDIAERSFWTGMQTGLGLTATSPLPMGAASIAGTLTFSGSLPEATSARRSQWERPPLRG